MANEKTQQILDLVKTLTILELADLVKAMEEEFGVSAAPVAVAAAPGAAAAGAPAAEEKTEFDVELTSFEEAKKLKVIKEVKDVTRPVSGRGEGPRYGRAEGDQDRRFKEEAEAHQGAGRSRRRCRYHQVKSNRQTRLRPAGNSLPGLFFTLTTFLLDFSAGFAYNKGKLRLG